MGLSRTLTKILKPIIDRNPTLAVGLRYGRDHRPLLGETQMTPNGFKMMGNPSMEAGKFEPDETRLVKQILQRCDVFINVGANIGYYMCHALAAGKRSLAFEPIELNQKYIYKNIMSNEWQALAEVYPIALSDKPGSMEMYGAGTAASLIKGWAGANSNPTIVPVARLDDVLGARFHGQQCFLLVDIEGAERFMLEGAKEFLARTPRPIWLMEITVGEHLPEGIKVNPNILETFDIFWKNGYEAWTADRQQRMVTRDEIEKIAATGQDTLGTHNFVFVAAGNKSSFL